MKRSIIVYLMCFSWAMAQKKLDTLSGYYVNNDAEFYFDKSGTFTYYDLSIYRSDVYIVFCNEWTRGNWKLKDEIIEINSNTLNNPIRLNILKRNTNNLGNSISIALSDTIFSNDYKVLLVNNKDKDSVETNGHQKITNIRKGEYFLKLLPNKENLGRRMIINNESLVSEIFTINENQHYDIELDFDKNIFAYRVFKNLKIKVKRNKIIFDKWNFKKMNQDYNSKISNYY